MSYIDGGNTYKSITIKFDIIYIYDFMTADYTIYTIYTIDRIYIVFIFRHVIYHLYNLCDSY